MWTHLMASPPPTTNEGLFLKHFITVLNAIITAAVLFCASFIFDMNRSTGELIVKVEALASQTYKLENKLDEINNTFVRRDDFNNLEGRVLELEKKSK